MKSKNESPKSATLTPVEPVHLHVFEALNNFDAYKSRKMYFTVDEKGTELLLNVATKKYNKLRIFKIRHNVLHSKAQIYFLKKVFNIINSLFAKLSSAGQQQTLAIAMDDIIFNYVDIQSFKDIGNGILKNGSVLLYKRPIILSDTEEIHKVLKFHHCTPIGGHLGINRLYRKVKTFYSWPNMKKVISNFVRSCNECILNKNYSRAICDTVITTTPAKALEILSIDTIGPFTLSEKGNRYAISMQCDLSKFLFLIAIPDKSAKTIAHAVVTQCFSIIGTVSTFKSDQGTEYKGVFDEICNLLKIEHVCSTAYHPQTIGALERSHRSLNDYLRIFCCESRTDWDEWLPYFCLAFNTVPSSEHGYTPYELVYGKTSRNLLENEPVSAVYNHDSYLVELKYKLQLAHRHAQEALLKAKTSRANSANIKDATELQIGDTVYLKNMNCHKLDKANTGPYKVTQTSVSNATIKSVDNKEFVVHKSRLIKFKQ